MDRNCFVGLDVGMAQELHIVCGLPASGKTTFAKALAKRVGAAFFDSDTATGLMVQASHEAAGYDPHDRDPLRYKQTFREPVYETLFALAKDNLPHVDVIIAGPFTKEAAQQKQWKSVLGCRFPNTKISIHYLQINEADRMERMKRRGALRDVRKLKD